MTTCRVLTSPAEPGERARAAKRFASPQVSHWTNGANHTYIAGLHLLANRRMTETRPDIMAHRTASVARIEEGKALSWDGPRLGSPPPLCWGQRAQAVSSRAGGWGLGRELTPGNSQLLCVLSTYHVLGNQQTLGTCLVVIADILGPQHRDKGVRSDRSWTRWTARGHCRLGLRGALVAPGKETGSLLESLGAGKKSVQRACCTSRVPDRGMIVRPF
ncbi:Inositol-Trisphosphate 3-Kinase C [Manis pentadactyla]|nr:Inositol-Trisphosphate 3-Kinase C [Manis pentadactyla]